MEDRNAIALRLSRLQTPERRDEQYEQVEEAYPAQCPNREQSDASEQDSEENAGLGFGGSARVGSGYSGDRTDILR